MNNSYQLYLKLNKSQDGLLIKQSLQEVGFINFKMTGNDLSNFRNYYFRSPESPNQLEVHFRILPNETKVSTIAIHLFFSCPAATLKILFNRLSILEEILPFQLLDLELRNRNYSELHKNKEYPKSSVIISQEQQDKADKTSYIPISFDDFIHNSSLVEKRLQFFFEEKIIGERAPDDLADRPRAKGN